ncbi:hypothetical protein N1851_000565 [Merluccius polli]|uniref:Reverse transcriptase domain-containing protein n=1 Tax=Merluccius polli TaxID=89951 RepID=A0AA47PDU5_MERPO|nr:hypothetical protein N1851_000565 [Merluccius polli]
MEGRLPGTWKGREECSPCLKAFHVGTWKGKEFPEQSHTAKCTWKGREECSPCLKAFHVGTWKGKEFPEQSHTAKCTWKGREECSPCLKAFHVGTWKGKEFPEQSHTAKCNILQMLSQSTEVQQQDRIHSLQDINTPVPGEEDLGKGEQPEPNPLRPAVEKKIQGKSKRQTEIDCLVKERRQLKKQWRKATEEEKEGINLLQGEIQSRLAALRRAENLLRKHRRKEQTRSRFYKDPFKFVKSIFTKEKSGSLSASKADLEERLRKSCTDDRRHEELMLSPDMPPVNPPEHQLDISPPRWSEVDKSVRRARAASAPGPNGVPYRLYKNAPHVLRFLWKPMRVVWQKKEIPTSWWRIGGILIPKEKDSQAGYLQRNNLIDMSIQKAGISGFSGCVEDASVIRHQIHLAPEGTDLHVVFLDLANAFGSVPHNLLWTAFDYFKVPAAFTALVKAYFQDIQLCLITAEYTTAWQHLEVGIMAGCTISPLAFTMAMEVIILASRWVVTLQHSPQPRLAPYGY